MKLSYESACKIMAMGSYEEVAKQYNIPKHQLALAVQNAFSKKAKEIDTKKEIASTVIEFETFEGVPIYKTVGAWTDSAEAKSYNQYKKISEA